MQSGDRLLMVFKPLVTALHLSISVLGCVVDSPTVEMYFSKDFYASEESGDMFGYELRIASVWGKHSLKFVEYTGGGDPNEVHVLMFKIDKSRRTMAFRVADLSFLSAGDTLYFEGNLSGRGVIGTGYFVRDSVKTSKIIEFVRVYD